MIEAAPEAVVSPVVEGAEPGQLAPRHGTPAHYLAAHTRGHSSHTPAATWGYMIYLHCAYLLSSFIREPIKKNMWKIPHLGGGGPDPGIFHI